MSDKNSNEMTNNLTNANSRLIQIRECMINLIHLICTLEKDYIEDKSLDFEDWLSVTGEITTLKILYNRLRRLESREIQSIGEAYIEENGGAS